MATTGKACMESFVGTKNLGEVLDFSKQGTHLVYGQAFSIIIWHLFHQDGLLYPQHGGVLGSSGELLEPSPTPREVLHINLSIDLSYHRMSLNHQFFGPLFII